MTRFACINGDFIPHAEARIPIEDRGLQFGDSIYEVFAVLNGRMIDAAAHLARLYHSAAAIQLNLPWTQTKLTELCYQLIARNQLDEGGLYLQITRGVAPRDFAFPNINIKPTLILTTNAVPVQDNPKAVTGLKVITVPDIRWQRRDIKSTNLLAQVLAHQAAKDNGADTAWLLDEDEMVNEAAYASAWIIKDGLIKTRQISQRILNGITRASILQLCQQQHLQFEEKAFSLAEAQAADEAFVTGALALVLPVTHIDGIVLGTGQPGPITRKLRQIYIDHALQNQPASVG